MENLFHAYRKRRGAKDEGEVGQQGETPGREGGKVKWLSSQIREGHNICLLLTKNK
jgi:hypothetical protein